MAENLPPGYSGGSILPTPSQPIEMKVFQGGGSGIGGATDSILAQPEHQIPLTEFRGGGDVNMKTKGNIITEAGQVTPEAAEAAARNKQLPKTDIETNKLSNGLVVRIMPDDNSLKADIQSLKFTGDEKILFEDVMHFKHPFFKKYLQKEENKEGFYEFWKLYTMYDGTDQYTLMTYEEGSKVQKFMKSSLDSFREYLMGAALPFLLKQDKPELLEIIQQPADPEKYALMETILIPQAPEPIEEPNARKQTSSSGEGESPPLLVLPEETLAKEKEDAIIVEKLVKHSEGEGEGEITPPLFTKLHTIMQGDIPKTRIRKRAFINEKIRGILQVLNKDIINIEEYKENFINTRGITSSSFLKDRTNIEKFFKSAPDPDDKLRDFLRDLIKIDLTQLDEKTTKAFHSFFLKIINPKSTDEFYTYVFGKSEENPKA